MSLHHITWRATASGLADETVVADALAWLMDDEEAVEPTPSPQAPPFFERDPMLDQLFADAQHEQQQLQEIKAAQIIMC